MQTETRERIANLTSSILNPFLVSLIAIFLLSFESTPSAIDALKWVLVLVAIGILPLFFAGIYLVRRGSLDSIFTSVRRQRTKLYLAAIVCAGVGYGVLLALKAPLMLEAAFATGLSAMVIFMGINLWWKMSLHTAFTAGLVTILIFVYGWIAAIAIVLVPMVAWARVELKYHSVAQAVAGALLAALIVIVAFYLFGLA